MARPKKIKECLPVKAKKPKAIAKVPIIHSFDPSIISDLILKGDLRQFTPEQKVKYYTALCKSLNLNPLTKPFDLIILNNKETLYANKGCAEQLRKLNKISVVEMTKQQINDIFEVTVKIMDKDGRYEMSTGAVAIKNLSGNELANAIMKAETKAKRRATLAICGLGMLDETELETINGIKYPVVTFHPEKTEEPSWKITTSEDKAKKKAKEEAQAKLDALPDYIKHAFGILGWKEVAQWNYCEMYQWDYEKIKIAVNAIVDKQK